MLKSWVCALAVLAAPLGGCELDLSENLREPAGSTALAPGILTGLDRPPAGQEQFRGQVTEVLSAGSYTYVRVLTDSGSARWVATMSRGLTPGVGVEVKNFGTRRQFHSKRLERSFDELVFGSVQLLGKPGRGGLS